ncbi:MobA/MobL family protein [Ruegeria sp. HKCCC2117]|uniref:MobA/MobL family protein n=1 Tax=Ruegeria sp. HKCCC2117 TaxID=2682992 RepID=UPI001488D5B4|nr:MobA/MobL family protein [Ruegeria sp. HKCCC2117]
MALFSFRHSVKTFSEKCRSADRVAKPGQTAAHLRYITRSLAAREVISSRMDGSSMSALAASVEKEAEKRKGRVCERFIIALPTEATQEQRAVLAKRFADELTQGKAPYILAIHDTAGNDAQNPHFHLVAFDQHVATGGRGRPRSVIGMARKNAIEKWARCWEEIHNDMMISWGFGPESMISHTSFAKRGIEKIPEIHEGPAARRMAKRKSLTPSKTEWKRIDAGQSRIQANVLIREINELKEKTEIEAANRLGSRNAGNTKQGNRSGPPLRTRSRRGIGITLGAGEAEKEACRRPGALAGDREPPWLANRSSERLEKTSELSQHRSPRKAEITDPIHPDRPPFRHRRFRRVFLELTMLRDTLLVRLALQRNNDMTKPSSIVASKHFQIECREDETQKRQKATIITRD